MMALPSGNQPSQPWPMLRSVGDCQFSKEHKPSSWRRPHTRNAASAPAKPLCHPGRTTLSSAASRDLPTRWPACLTYAYEVDSTTYVCNGEDGVGSASCVVWPGESIQDCVDSVAAAGGGEVLVRAGTHELTDHVHISTSNVTLRGEGAASVLWLADSVNRSNILIGPTVEFPTSDPIENIVIEDLTVDGNKDNQSSETYMDPDRDHIRVNGLTIRRANNVQIRRITTTRARSGGIVTTDDVRYFLAEDVVSTENYFDGLALYLTEESIVRGCLLQNNSAGGISTDIQFNGNLIVNNIIADNGRGEDGASANPGLYMSESRDNLIADNLIVGSAGNGIVLTNNGGDGAADNVFHGNVIADSGEYGIWIAQPNCTGNRGHGTCYRDNTLGNVLESTPGIYTDTDVLCE